MNSNEAPLWSNQQNVGDPAMDSRIDDFSHYLNFDFDIGSHGLIGDSFHHDPNAMETDYAPAVTMEGSAGLMESAPMSSGGMMNMHLQSIQNLQQQQQAQQQAQQQLAIQEAQMRQGGLRHNMMSNSMIPPTPSSMELQSGDATPQMYHRMYMKDDQMIFTPLVSPAVTPLVTPIETSYGHPPDFTMPGAYFSPLTSPALEAQRHGVYSMHNIHMSSKNTSPIEFTGSPVIKAKPPSTASGRRKSTAGRNPSRVARKSPSVKPQRKKGPIPLVSTPDLKSNLQQPSTPSRQAFNNAALEHISIPSSRDSSSESISPEPMPESLMPPPPTRSGAQQVGVNRPRSGGIEDTMGPPPSSSSGNEGSSSASSFSVTPATPASLMKLPKSSIPADAMNPSPLAVLDNDSIMEENHSSSKHDEDNQSTPTIAPSTRTNTPFMKPASSASSHPSTHTSRNPSPHSQTAPTSSNSGGICTLPNSTNSTPTLAPLNSSKKEPPLKSSASSRKRPSISASPALIPKISPNLKPLLPDTLSSTLSSTSHHTQTSAAAAAAAAASLLLASKSNYQNIVEGNHSSLGLSYPEHLSTNLTSKRTSHKIAEQGRRNRINNALIEIAALLPSVGTPMLSASASPGTTDGRDKDKDGKGGKDKEDKSSGGINAQGQTSKAVTVERAIEYIKSLKKDLDEARGELELVRGRLANFEGGVNEDRGKRKREEEEEEEVVVEEGGRGKVSTQVTVVVEKEEEDKNDKAENEEGKEGTSSKSASHTTTAAVNDTKKNMDTDREMRARETEEEKETSTSATTNENEEMILVE